jgi:hypothetical protein
MASSEDAKTFIFLGETWVMMWVGFYTPLVHDLVFICQAFMVMDLDFESSRCKILSVLTCQESALFSTPRF